MPLPKIDQPLFEMTIPSSGKKVKYRPFTVKEEKVLLIAQESKDIEQIILAMKQIINNCLVDTSPDDLAVFDLEYIMIKLRAKSVNNVIDFKITDPDTEEEIEVNINIDELEVERSENHKTVLNVTDTIALKMKYPTIDYLRDISDTPNESTLFKLMKQCIHSVVQGDDVFKLSDFTEAEIEEFIDSLGSEIITEIRDFFETIPQMKFEHKYVNKNGDEKTFVAKGTETFFI
jgi:hypothetical protein